jgi:hypothetical protein
MNVPYVEALSKPLADATERVPPVRKSQFLAIFGGPRSVVAVFGRGFASASINKVFVAALLSLTLPALLGFAADPVASPSASQVLRYENPSQVWADYDTTVVVSTDFNAAIPSKLGNAKATDKTRNSEVQFMTEGTP